MDELVTVNGYWIAKTLGPVVVKWAAGKLFDEVFGSHPSSVNIAEIIETIIARIAAVVKQEVQANALRDCLAKLNSAQRMFAEYLRAPTADRLHAATKDSSAAISQLASFKLSGHDSYVGAVTFRLPTRSLLSGVHAA